MADPKDCRARALRCAELANATREPRLQELLFDMAGTWLKLATELERTHAQLDEETLGFQVNEPCGAFPSGPGWRKRGNVNGHEHDGKSKDQALAVARRG